MKKLAFVLLATVAFAPYSFAQEPEQGAAAPVAPDAAPADQTAPPAGGTGGKGAMMKEAVQACRKQAMAQGLSQGKAMRQAVTDCVIKDHPGMANIMKCRMAAMDNGLKPGSPELKSSVKACVKKARGA